MGDDRLLRHDPHPVEHASPRQHGVHAGHAPGVADPVDGRRLRRPEVRVVGQVDRAQPLRTDEQRGAGGTLGPPDGPQEVGRRVGVVQEPGHPSVLLDGKPDPQVQAERAGHLVREERPERSAVDPSHELAHEPAVADRVVAEGGPRLPGQGCRGEPGRDLIGAMPPRLVVAAHEIPVPGEGRKPERVAEDLADQRPVLSLRGELGPVHGHGDVHVHQAAVGQDLGHQGCCPLRHREQEDERVLRPRAIRRRHPRPQVDHAVAPHVCAELGPHLAPDGEVLPERVDNRFEACGHMPADVDHCRRLT